MFTHGVEVGASRNETHNLQTATNELIASLAQGNPGLSRPSGYDRVNTLFYAVAVAPRSDFPSYRSVFDRVISSIQLID